MFVSRYIGLWYVKSYKFPVLKIIIILAFFFDVGIRFSDKHLRYNTASVFEMVSFFLLSMFRCIYSHCLLLAHSSYIVMLLPPPIMLYIVPRLSQFGLWYYVHCHIARCRMPLLLLWSNLYHGMFYLAGLGVWYVCLGQAYAFFGLSLGCLVP